MCHADVTRAVLVEKCGGTVVRYRVVNRTVYTDCEHGERDILYTHRDAFLEMLLMAIWLYRDFPDVELWLSTADEPSSCSLHVPVLQYSILDMNTTKAARYSDVGYVDGVPFSIPHLLTGERPKGQPRPSSVQFTRGYAIPHGPVWESLSMLPEELQMLQARVMAASQQKQPQLRPQAVWRGTNTGSLRGWPPESSDILSRYGDPWAPLLFTKRAHLVRMSQMHPDILDVGLHEVTSHLLSESIGWYRLCLASASGLVYGHYVA